ncbi:hypothetical protein P409_05580, partial [Inquilinus limosus MP06]
MSTAGNLEAWSRSTPDPARQLLPAITCPEPLDGPRLAACIRHTPLLRRAYLRSLRLAAAVGDGLLLPMGFEFAAREIPAGTAEDELRWARQAAPFDLTAEIAATIAALGRRGDGPTALRGVSAPGASVVALLRTATEPRPERAELILTNADLHRPSVVRPAQLLR